MLTFGDINDFSSSLFYVSNLLQKSFKKGCITLNFKNVQKKIHENIS